MVYSVTAMQQTFFHCSVSKARQIPVYQALSCVLLIENRNRNAPTSLPWYTPEGPSVQHFQHSVQCRCWNNFHFFHCFLWSTQVICWICFSIQTLFMVVVWRSSGLHLQYRVTCSWATVMFSVDFIIQCCSIVSFRRCMYCTSPQRANNALLLALADTLWSELEMALVSLHEVQ